MSSLIINFTWTQISPHQRSVTLVSIARLTPNTSGNASGTPLRKPWSGTLDPWRNSPLCWRKHLAILT